MNQLDFKDQESCSVDSLSAGVKFDTLPDDSRPLQPSENKIDTIYDQFRFKSEFSYGSLPWLPMNERLRKAQMVLHELSKQRTNLDDKIREALSEVQAATLAMLGGAEIPPADPKLTSGPVQHRVVIYLGRENDWRDVDAIVEATQLQRNQVEICLRNGRARYKLFDLSNSQWRLAQKGKEEYDTLTSTP